MGDDDAGDGQLGDQVGDDLFRLDVEVGGALVEEQDPRRSGRAGRGKIEKQKEGKKRMRQFGKVEIPQEAFIAALKMDGD